MHGILSRCLAAAVLLHASVAMAQQAPAPRAFAAPETADSLPTGAAGGIGQTTLALLVVLAAIFGLAWLARRMRGLARGNTRQGIDVIAQAAVGPRERVVIVRVGETRLLLGVAPGRVSRLHELPADATLDGTPGAGVAAVQGGAGALVETFRNLMARARQGSDPRNDQDGGK